MSNSSKLSCMLSSIPASMKSTRSRTAEKNRIHRFSHYKPMGIFFFRHSRAAHSAVGGPIRPKFELVQALMHVIITCKFKKERMKKAEEKWRHRFSHHNPIYYNGNQWLNLAEFQTHPRSHVCYHYLQV